MIDLSDIYLEDENYRVKVNTVFESGIIKINPDLPTKIVVDSVFAGASVPDGNNISFGNYTYRSKGFKENSNYIEIDASVVFGELRIVRGD